MPRADVSQIPRERLQALREREVQRFAELRPRGTRLLERATASMPNGVPTSWMATLYDHPPIPSRPRAKSDATAARVQTMGPPSHDFGPSGARL